MTDLNQDKLRNLVNDFLIGKGEKASKVIAKLRELNKLPREELVEIFNYFLMHETDPEILLFLVKELSGHKSKTSTPVFIDLLNNSNGFEKNNKFLNIRCVVAKTLGIMQDESAVLSLMYVMNDKNENYKLRLSAAEALGKIGSSYAVNPLINIVTDEAEKSVYVRESAAKALGMLGDERAIDPLANLLETKKGILDKFTFLKEKTAEALGKLGSKGDRRIKALKNVLMDESHQVRISAITALSEIEDDRVLSLIKPMLYDKHEEVGKEAVYALYNIMGRGYIIDLLEDNKLPSHCRDEISELLAEDDELEEDDE